MIACAKMIGITPAVIDLERKMGRLPANHFAAHLPLRVLDADPAGGLGNRDDSGDDREEKPEQEHQRHAP